jgi:hypothetical protein
VKETKFKLTLSAPVDKNGMTVKLTIINIEDLNTLRISHYPEFMWYAIGIALLLGISLIAALIDLSNLIWTGIILGVIAYNLFFQRAFFCSINKSTGRIIYSRSGILMSRFDERKEEFNISKISRLEMERYIRGGRWGWADTFQIYLLFEGGQRIPLSPNNLDFGECHEFAEQIRNFIGSEIQIKAVEKEPLFF